MSLISEFLHRQEPVISLPPTGFDFSFAFCPLRLNQRPVVDFDRCSFADERQAVQRKFSISIMSLLT
jgi:hypothetical protein